MAAVVIQAPTAAASVLIKGLSEAELDMTVEEFLKDQCKQRITTLKRHADELIGRYEEEVGKARKTLHEAEQKALEETVREEDLTEPAADGAADGGGAVEAGGPLCEPFAMVAIRGIHLGKIVRFEPTSAQKSWSVGRVAECDICLAGDDEVSSRHAKIHFEKKQFKLMDEDSTNGTFATNATKGNTVRLKPSKNHVLKENHLITFGGSTFRWCSNDKADEHASYAKEMKQ